MSEAWKPLVYAARVPHEIDPPLLAQGLSRISAERRQRIEKFRSRADQYRSILAELLVCRVLRDSFGLDDTDIRFCTGPYGKPYLAGKGPFFNFSHSGEWVIAVFHHNEVGIDIEQIRPMERDMAARFFAPEENMALAELSIEEWTPRFYRLWTMKEAYVKASGSGLRIPLHSFTFLPDQDAVERFCVVERGQLKDVNVYVLPWGNHYACAICCSDNTQPEAPVIMQPEALLSSQVDLIWG
ncbi:4'-phosphopantetheinyl transferase [Paenibacillus phyllosphaerae]|uniref:4'-phosphopantetheinyl transferase n=1 Tax=Paenibacillus phyllosphaerae TaxID=274593 RepID=A0A7W5B2K5_9BACL|nr:4'-phosphopantetheinyl transferase superfamily protein [Paenibacillus phyllosphaerae]MBB3113019.1 4'-phosphopantetheinyl transferase [Paenibacillus phyllosphaerae]